MSTLPAQEVTGWSLQSTQSLVPNLALHQPILPVVLDDILILQSYFSGSLNHNPNTEKTDPTSKE